MHNIPHREETKELIKAKLKQHWANLTDEQRKQRKQKILDYHKHLNDVELQEKAMQWEKQHREYILNEYKRLFTSTKS